jgi:dTDP-4-dehydrorhamnose reductase
MTKVLILGSTGLLGSTISKYFSIKSNFKCFGTIRKSSDRKKLKYIKNIKLYKVDFEKSRNLRKVFKMIKPNLIINCIGVVKQVLNKNMNSEIIRINSFLPHHLLELANENNKIRFIHFSTDCVFSGLKGNYSEDDVTDAKDIYGASKMLGEVNYPNSITLRTSIIGHELNTKYSLLNWFLSQKKSIKGYKNAIFSGLTALEIARALEKYIIPKKKIKGIYHLSGKPISKYDLLYIIKKIYKKKIKIMPDSKIKINRSLNANLFKRATGYKPKSWNKLIQEMYDFHNFN